MKKEKHLNVQSSEPKEGVVVQILDDGFLINEIKSGKDQKIVPDKNTVFEEYTFSGGKNYPTKRKIVREELKEGDKVSIFLKMEGDTVSVVAVNRMVDVSLSDEVKENLQDDLLLSRFSDLGLDYIELLSLMKGIKPLIFDKIKKERKEDFIKLMKDIGIEYRFIGKESIESNASELLVDDTEFFMISKDSQLNVEFENIYFKEGSYDKLANVGMALGYPKCCSQHYINGVRNRHSETRVRDLYYQSVHNSSSFNTLCNSFFCFYGRGNNDVFQKMNLYLAKNDSSIFWGSSQIFFISHAPCSFDCKESIEHGRKVYEMLKDYNLERAEKIKSILSKPILFFNMFEFIVLEGTADKEKASYTGIAPPFSLVDEGVLKKVREGDELVVYDDRIELSKNGKPIHTIFKKKKEDGFLIPFSDIIK